MKDLGRESSLSPGSGEDPAATREQREVAKLRPRVDQSGIDAVIVERLLPFDRRRGADRRRSMVVTEEVRIAVLIPCRNEERTVAEVVREFKTHLPSAEIHVCDNASTDRTAEFAKAAGATVHYEARPGKGHVIRRMFAEVDADVYVMADGDGTYDAGAAPQLVTALLSNRLDMVVGRRREMPGAATYRRGHRLGNVMLTGVVQYIFGQGCMDMLSGYRVFSRRYVKSFPVSSRGFEIETEMTVHALDLGLPVSEIDTIYDERPADSYSKLRTIPDGLKILAFIAVLVKEYRPALFFGFFGVLVGALALLGYTAFNPFFSSLTTPTSVVVTAIVLAVVAVLLLLAGVILDSLSRSRREVKRMMYLGAGTPRARHGNVSPTVLEREVLVRSTDGA